jgi:N-acetylglutamate synthase and related acetyltransferases
MGVEIITRTSTMAYAGDFKRINEDWISSNFWLEESDIQVLNDPQKYILDKGGNVFIALLDGVPVGTCALIVRDMFTCELAKMAVDTKARGRGIGYLLGVALIEKARERGFSRIVLEGNTKMTASISLYRKLGFEEIPLNGIDNNQEIHERCNIFMELINNQGIQAEYYI